MDINSTKKSMARDTLLYLPTKVIEGIIGFLTISLYTSFFNPDVFGDYTMVNTTINICSLLLTGWLLQATFRYVNSFQTPRKRTVFFSTVFTVWASVNLFSILLGSIALFVCSFFLRTSLIQLGTAALFMFVSYNTAQMLFSLLSALRRIKLNLILSLVSVSGKVALTSLMVYQWKNNDFTPISAILSNGILDLTVSLIIIWRLQLYRKIRIRFFSRKVLNKFLQYGLPLMGVSMTSALLNLSDRFVIRPILGSAQVGIYSANYSIASAVFTMILIGVMRGVYPMILKSWNKNDLHSSELLLSQAVRYYILVALPAAVGLSALSRPIASLFFHDPAYAAGTAVMIYVSFGMFFLGLTEYSNKAWELTGKTLSVFRYSLISGVFNLTANLILVPLFGYMAAAVNTAAAYLLYLLLSLHGSRKLLRWHIPARSYIRMLASNVLMGAVLVISVQLIPPSLPILLLLVVVGGGIYGVSLYLSGEVKYEVHALLGWVKRRR